MKENFFYADFRKWHSLPELIQIVKTTLGVTVISAFCIVLWRRVENYHCLPEMPQTSELPLIMVAKIQYFEASWKRSRTKNR
jgi:hypothetical protein